MNSKEKEERVEQIKSLAIEISNAEKEFYNDGNQHEQYIRSYELLMVEITKKEAVIEEIEKLILGRGGC